MYIYTKRKKTMTTETGRSGLCGATVAVSTVNWTFLKYISRQGRVLVVVAGHLVCNIVNIPQQYICI